MWRTGVVVFALVGCARIFGLDEPTVNPTQGDGGATTATIGGTVRGLGAASGLVVQNNGGDDMSIASDGSFRFPTAVDLGTAYAVTVSVQPTNPSERCAVGSGSGVANADVTDVVVTCGLASFSVGGTVAGLSGSVTLHNGTDSLVVTANGNFMFPTTVASGQGYNVTASNNAACLVLGGTGTVGNADVTSVLVNCAGATGPYAIGGMVNGVNGTVKLHNASNGDNVSVSGNGTYAFPMLVPSTGMYNVTVLQQPAYPPATQVCTVANASGAANGNVQNINVTCVTSKFTIGGQINGLSGTLKLLDNGGDSVTTSMSGGYTFATALASGTTWNVTVGSKPANQTCAVSNAAGVVSSSDVTNVNATCSYLDQGIKCGGTYCTAGSQGCCQPNGTPTCTTSSSCTASLWLECDDKADCGGGQICCAAENGGRNAVLGVSCSLTCGQGDILCDPNAQNPCAGGKSCLAFGLLPGYYACQ